MNKIYNKEGVLIATVDNDKLFEMLDDGIILSSDKIIEE